MLRTTLAVGLGLTALVCAGPPAEATDRNPPVTTISYGMASGEVGSDGWTGSTSFGNVSVVPTRNATDVGETFHLYAERSGCDTEGCTKERIFVYGQDSEDALKGRLSVAPNLSSVTLAPTTVSVARSVTHYDSEGRYVDTSWTRSEETLSATATATDGRERDAERVRTAGSRVLVSGTDRAATVAVTLGDQTFTATADSGVISSGSDRWVTTHSSR